MPRVQQTLDQSCSLPEMTYGEVQQLLGYLTSYRQLLGATTNCDPLLLDGVSKLRNKIQEHLYKG